jgi:transposase InsO family protein
MYGLARCHSLSVTQVPDPTQVEVPLAVFEFIEGWDNPHRRHSALDYESPISYQL